MGVYDYFADIIDAICTRKARKNYIKSLEEFIDSEEELIKTLKDLNTNRDEYIKELKDINARLLEQLEKSEALTTTQYNKLSFLSEEVERNNAVERDYKYKIGVLTKALGSTRCYLENYVDVGKDFAFSNPPKGQFMIIDAALKEGLRPVAINEEVKNENV